MVSGLRFCWRDPRSDHRRHSRLHGARRPRLHDRKRFRLQAIVQRLCEIGV
jgi:hypothetical protein